MAQWNRKPQLAVFSVRSQQDVSGNTVNPPDTSGGLSRCHQLSPYLCAYADHFGGN